MYLRKTSRRYKDKTYTSYVLVESVRTPKGPRQKTICSLGDLAPRPRQEWLKLFRKIVQALSDQPDTPAIQSPSRQQPRKRRPAKSPSPKVSLQVP